MKTVIVSGSFGDMSARDIRFLQEASKYGCLHALVWGDNVIVGRTKFPQEERMYMMDAIRYVDRATLMTELADRDGLPDTIHADIWVVDERDDTPQRRHFCDMHNITYRVLTADDIKGFPVTETADGDGKNKKVIVTGCFDWFHSGHIRFFEEVSELGDLYVVVGHDANVRLLKGENHPMFNENERRYVVQSIRFVTQGLISSGNGWMDAAPEIAVLKPDIYAVNEDGDKPEKRVFCEEHGLEYVVLKRAPKEGLPHRESTVLRGF